jgi:hypothetical protein
MSLAFFSESTRDLKLMGLMRLLLQSYLNNQKYEITGILFYDGKSFSQIMEGPTSAIDERWQLILRDDRHDQIHLVGKSLIASRSYSNWSMRTRDGGIVGAMFPELAEIISENHLKKPPSEIIRAAYRSQQLIQALPTRSVVVPVLH